MTRQKYYKLGIDADIVQGSDVVALEMKFIPVGEHAPEMVGKPCMFENIFRPIRQYKNRKLGLLRRFIPDCFTAWGGK
jgi:hypothetical protein